MIAGFVSSPLGAPAVLPVIGGFLALGALYVRLQEQAAKQRREVTAGGKERKTSAWETLKAIIAEDKPQYVKELFDTIAEDYDRMNWIMTGGLLALWHRRFLRQTRLAPGETAADVCCGTGDLTFLMARRVGPRGAVTGLDFSEIMLAIARRRAEALAAKEPGKLAPITWTQGTPFPSPLTTVMTIGALRRSAWGLPCATSATSSRLCERWPASAEGGRDHLPGGLAPESSLTGRFSHSFLPRRADFGQDGGAAPAPREPSAPPPPLYVPALLPRSPAPAPRHPRPHEGGRPDRGRQIPLTGGVVSLYVGVKP